MSSQRNPLLGPDAAHANAASDEGSTKRPYRAPELRKLGSVSELTHQVPYGTGGDFDGYASYDS